MRHVTHELHTHQTCHTCRPLSSRRRAAAVRRVASHPLHITYEGIISHRSYTWMRQITQIDLFPVFDELLQCSASRLNRFAHTRSFQTDRLCYFLIISLWMCYTCLCQGTRDWVVMELCHVWMSRVVHVWFMSHMKEACHPWMHQTRGCVTYEWVVSCIYDLCHIWKRHVIHECVRLVVVSHMNESCRASMIYVIYERGMSYTWMRQTRSYWADRLYHSSIHFLTSLFCNRHV